MAYINPSTGLPLPPTAGMSQFTAELRYRINTEDTYDDFAFGNFEVEPIWWNVGGGWLSADSGPDIRMSEGYQSLAIAPDWSYFKSICGEGTQGCGPPIFIDQGQPPAFQPTTRGEWHTLRLIQDEAVNLTQEVYVDGVLITSHDISGYNRANGFTRSLAIGQRGQLYPFGTEDAWMYNEVMYDYIRIADSIVDISEPLDAPGAGFDADFDGDGFVDNEDLLLWKTGFPKSSGASKIDGDADNDGDVDGGDFLVWQTEFPSPGSGAGSLAVPEPAGIVMLLIGLLYPFGRCRWVCVRFMRAAHATIDATDRQR